LRSLVSILLALTYLSCTAQGDFNTPNLRESVKVETSIYTVWYSETKEQPIRLVYKSSNRPKNVDRGSMDFYKENNGYTKEEIDRKKIALEKTMLIESEKSHERRFLNIGCENFYKWFQCYNFASWILIK